MSNIFRPTISTGTRNLSAWIDIFSLRSYLCVNIFDSLGEKDIPVSVILPTNEEATGPVYKYASFYASIEIVSESIQNVYRPGIGECVFVNGFCAATQEKLRKTPGDCEWMLFSYDGTIFRFRTTESAVYADRITFPNGAIANIAMGNDSIFMNLAPVGSAGALPPYSFFRVTLSYPSGISSLSSISIEKKSPGGDVELLFAELSSPSVDSLCYSITRLLPGGATDSCSLEVGFRYIGLEESRRFRGIYLYRGGEIVESVENSTYSFVSSFDRSRAKQIDTVQVAVETSSARISQANGELLARHVFSPGPLNLLLSSSNRTDSCSGFVYDGVGRLTHHLRNVPFFEDGVGRRSLLQDGYFSQIGHYWHGGTYASDQDVEEDYSINPSLAFFKAGDSCYFIGPNATASRNLPFYFQADASYCLCLFAAIIPSPGQSGECFSLKITFTPGPDAGRVIQESYSTNDFPPQELRLLFLNASSAIGATGASFKVTTMGGASAVIKAVQLIPGLSPSKTAYSGNQLFPTEFCQGTTLAHAEYDVLGNVLSRWGGGVDSPKVEYIEHTRIVSSKKDWLGSGQSYQYVSVPPGNDNNQCLSVLSTETFDGLSLSESYTYDPDTWAISSKTGQDGVITSFQYDVTGKEISLSRGQKKSKTISTFLPQSNMRSIKNQWGVLLSPYQFTVEERKGVSNPETKFYLGHSLLHSMTFDDSSPGTYTFCWNGTREAEYELRGNNETPFLVNESEEGVGSVSFAYVPATEFDVEYGLVASKGLSNGTQELQRFEYVYEGIEITGFSDPLSGISSSTSVERAETVVTTTSIGGRTLFEQDHISLMGTGRSSLRATLNTGPSLVSSSTASICPSSLAFLEKKLIRAGAQIASGTGWAEQSERAEFIPLLPLTQSCSFSMDSQGRSFSAGFLFYFGSANGGEAFKICFLPNVITFEISQNGELFYYPSINSNPIFLCTLSRGWHVFGFSLPPILESDATAFVDGKRYEIVYPRATPFTNFTFSECAGNGICSLFSIFPAANDAFLEEYIQDALGVISQKTVSIAEESGITARASTHSILGRVKDRVCEIPLDGTLESGWGGPYFSWSERSIFCQDDDAAFPNAAGISAPPRFRYCIEKGSFMLACFSGGVSYDPLGDTFGLSGYFALDEVEASAGERCLLAVNSLGGEFVRVSINGSRVLLVFQNETIDTGLTVSGTSPKKFCFRFVTSVSSSLSSLPEQAAISIGVSISGVGYSVVKRDIRKLKLVTFSLGSRNFDADEACHLRGLIGGIILTRTDESLASLMSLEDDAFSACAESWMDAFGRERVSRLVAPNQILVTHVYRYGTDGVLQLEAMKYTGSDVVVLSNTFSSVVGDYIILQNYPFLRDYRGYVVTGMGEVVSYDTRGNILSRKMSGEENPFISLNYETTGKRRLISATGITITYQSVQSPYPQSITENAVTTSFLYFGSGMVRSVTKGGVTYTYDYDENGMRAKKTSSLGQTTIYHYDGDKMIYESKVGEFEIHYSYDPSGKLAFLDYISNIGTVRRYYAVVDSLGVIRAVCDGEGNAATFSYGLYGDVRSVSDLTPDLIASKSSLRYKSYPFEAELGLYLLGGRLYHPLLGRFLAPDSPGFTSIGEPSGLNPYCYCRNDPVTYTDPDGHMAVTTIMLLVGIGVGAAIGAATNVASQYISNGGWDNFSWASLGWNTLMGAASGALAMSSLGSIAMIFANGALGAIGAVGSHLIAGDDFGAWQTWLDIGLSTSTGLLAGWLGGAGVMHGRDFAAATSSLAKATSSYSRVLSKVSSGGYATTRGMHIALTRTGNNFARAAQEMYLLISGATNDLAIALAATAFVSTGYALIGGLAAYEW